MKGLLEFMAKHLGVVLYPGQREILQGWAQSGKHRAILALGRRSGKNLIAGGAAIFNALAMDYSGLVRPNETRFIFCIATREPQSREFCRTTRELIEAAPDPDVRAAVDESASSADEIVFKTGVVLRSMPCSSRSVRGLPVSLLVLDELAWFETTEEGLRAGRTVYRAAMPSVMQFKDKGFVLITTTPGPSQGIFWDLWRSVEAGTDSNWYAVRRPVWEVRSDVTRESLQSEFVADPEGAATEYGAEFLQGAGSILNPDSITAAVIPGRKENPYLDGARYVAVADPGFAQGGSEFAVCIGHPEWEEQEDGSWALTTVVDRLVGWRGERGPLNSDAVFDEIAVLLREFHLHEIISDQYSVETVTDALRKRGVDVIKQAMYAQLKMDIFASLKRQLNRGLVELVDDPVLLQQLVSLQQRPGPSGWRIAGTGRDDRAVCVATLTHALATETATVENNYPMCATVGATLVGFE